mmetsp:Transcript_22795/g.67049  ORF Transcript_22795/g.67049 Transcript_22795/m.67049 type:complete len:245 (+) Transcript_22795:422-1156(+)
MAAEGGVPRVAAPELVRDGRRSSAAWQRRLQSGDGGVDPRDRALGLGGREVVERAAAAARVERPRLGRVPPDVVEVLPRHRGGALAGARGEVQLVVAAARSPQAGAPPPVAAAAGAGRASKEEEAAVRARLAPPGQERAEVPPVEQLRARSPAREPDGGGEHVQQRGHGGRHAAGRHGARQVPPSYVVNLPPRSGPAEPAAGAISTHGPLSDAKSVSVLRAAPASETILPSSPIASSISSSVSP